MDWDHLWKAGAKMLSQVNNPKKLLTALTLVGEQAALCILEFSCVNEASAMQIREVVQCG